MLEEPFVYRKAKVEIVDTITGELVSYIDEAMADDSDDLLGFMWGDGNYACDCNRANFFADAKGIEHGPTQFPCGDGRYRVKITDLETGNLLYEDQWPGQ